jgi:hypothetical protein
MSRFEGWVVLRMLLPRQLKRLHRDPGTTPWSVSDTFRPHLTSLPSPRLCSRSRHDIRPDEVRQTERFSSGESCGYSTNCFSRVRPKPLRRRALSTEAILHLQGPGHRGTQLVALGVMMVEASFPVHALKMRILGRPRRRLPFGLAAAGSAREDIDVDTLLSQLSTHCCFLLIPSHYRRVTVYTRI